MAIAYAQNFVSFVFLDSGINDFIRAIYLYGSAVRGELENDSDIDIFIDCKAENEKDVDGIVKASLSKFYKSNDFDKWKLYSFNHPISVQVGDLHSWRLKISIMADGILLYSKKAEILPAERKVIFTFEFPKKKSHYLKFRRRLFGRKEEGYKDKGILGQVNGIKLGSNLIIIPKEYQKNIMEFMQKGKINYSMKEICVFE